MFVSAKAGLGVDELISMGHVLELSVAVEKGGYINASLIGLQVNRDLCGRNQIPHHPQEPYGLL